VHEDEGGSTTSTETLRLKNEQKHDLTVDLEQKTTACTKTKEEATATMCAITVVREEMVKINGGGARPLMRDCQVGEWVEESCTKTCGGGTQVLRREIIVDPFFGAVCPPLEMQRPCNEQPCPVDCVMGEWKTWGPCSKECGEGVQERLRDIITPMDHDGEPCSATLESRECTLGPCDRDCGLKEWTSFSACDKVCHKGHEKSVRPLDLDVPAIGNGVCWGDRDPERLVEQDCNDIACPTFLVCESKIDIVILMDGSGSIGYDGFKAQKVFVNALLDRMSINEDGVKVSIVVFSRYITTLSPLSSNVQELKSKVSAVSFPSSTTNTAGALFEAINQLRAGRKDATSVVFVITDGMPNSDTATAVQSHEARKSSRVIFVPIGPYLDMTRVNSWASQPPRDNVIPLTDLASATDHLSTMIADLCPLANAYCPTAFQYAGGVIPATPVANLYDDKTETGLPHVLGDIGGAFSFAARVRMDRRVRWGRIFDFGNGPRRDNILAANVGYTTYLGVFVWNGYYYKYLYVPNFFVEGQTFDFMLTISYSGLLKIYKDGILVRETNLYIVPESKPRNNLFIGKSNWWWDGNWVGEISNVRIWNEEVDRDCEHGGRTFDQEEAE